MIREKYETLSLVILKDLAKARGLTRISTLKKGELIERMLEADAEDERKNAASAITAAPSVPKPATAASDRGTKAAGSVQQKSTKSKSADTADADSVPEAAPAAETAPAAEAKAASEPHVRQKASHEPQSKQRIVTKPHTVSKAHAEKKPSAETKQRADAKPDTETKPRTETMPRTGTKPRAETKPHTETKPRAEMKPYTETKPRTEIQSHSKAKPRQDNKTSKSESKPLPKTGMRAKQTHQTGVPVSDQDVPGTGNRVSDGAAIDSTPVSVPAGEAEQTPVQAPDRKGEQINGQNSESRVKPDTTPNNIDQLDNGVTANGILEVMPDGYGFIRCANYLPGDNDVYVSPSQIRRFNLKTGDILSGNTRVRFQTEKFSALIFLKSINGYPPAEAAKRANFEDMTPIFPNERIRLETDRRNLAMRIVDVFSPIGKGQRGMIVSPPKAGKTTLLKEIALSVRANNPEMHLIILLIDERPEEVTDMKEAIGGKNVEVIYSTFDELPEHHKRVSEMVIERAKRLVEHKQDVMILLDSITRLARAYNLTVPPSGRTLSGGLDPAALHMPKRFFGSARNMREGGSLTILATALVDTGSKMDDVVYEEFKGTGNMELVLDRKLSEKRVFPAIDIPKSGTRREDLLLSKEELEAVFSMRRALNGMKSDDAVESILTYFIRTRSNREFIQFIRSNRIF